MPDSEVVGRFFYSEKVPVEDLRKLANADGKLFEILVKLFADCEKEMTEGLLAPGVEQRQGDFIRGLVRCCQEVQSMKANARKVLDSNGLL